MSFYWRSWRRQLWKTHLAVFVAVTALIWLVKFDAQPVALPTLFQITTWGLCPIAVFVAMPMILFKPQQRILTVDGTGIETTIGSKSGAVKWSEVARIIDDGETLTIQGRNLNAFVVPARAFETTADRARFCEFVQSRFAAAGN